jgi:hypothetical protein
VTPWLPLTQQRLAPPKPEKLKFLDESGVATSMTRQ